MNKIIEEKKPKKQKQAMLALAPPTYGFAGLRVFDQPLGQLLLAVGQQLAAVAVVQGTVYSKKQRLKPRCYARLCAGGATAAHRCWATTARPAPAVGCCRRWRACGDGASSCS